VWKRWGKDVDKNGLKFLAVVSEDCMMNKKYFLMVLVLVVVVAVGWAVYYFWLGASVPQDYQQGMSFIENYEKLMREDIYGGKTPEETLKLFVEALKKEDVELASKYFMLDDEGGREKWVERLNELKEKKLLVQMAEDIEKKAKPTQSSYENDAGFKFISDTGLVIGIIDMELNKFSGLWKIESL
jgi:hypothetical protein